MITVRQMERLWSGKAYEKLFRELLAARPEASLRLEMELGRSIPTAALAIVRLDELSQAYVPLYSQLVRTVLNDQHSDGGWGDPMITAICVRALTCGGGNGVAVERGLQYLANMQKAEGIWPNVPIRRMPADPYVSAFILLQLGDHAAFRRAVRFFDAINWFEANEAGLDPDARRLWDRASLRCGMKSATRNGSGPLWS
ncbi:MAG TPA: hypothetical protein VLI90_19865 [Tepidisphaeraceae bacterium]|nr:hypothetical protein [Tepidisphaeraceae bacterium]